MNQKFPKGEIKSIQGRSFTMKGDDIDTDRIIPARFLKCVSFSALGEQVFADDRKELKGNHPFDLDQNKGANILVVNDNFGCGSSREHAPWALQDFGVKAVISTSFADIFYNNCFKNGILPIVVTPAERDALLADAKDPDNPELDIDLPNQVIHRPNGADITFDIDPFRKQCLLDGLDDIGLTMGKAEKISTYAEGRKTTHPWL